MNFNPPRNGNVKIHLRTLGENIGQANSNVEKGLFSRVHATLQPALSVGQSVGWLVGWSVTFYFFNDFFYPTAPAQMVK